MPSASPVEYTDWWEFTNGFVPNSNQLEQIPQTIYNGQNVWVKGPGNTVSDNGAVSVGPVGANITPAMVSNAVIAGLVGGGTVVSYDGVYWWSGPQGAVGYANGVLLGTVGAPKTGMGGGALMFQLGGVATEAGLLQPGAPTIDANGAPAGDMAGSYALGVATLRVGSGAVSTVSVASNVVTSTNQQLRITSPGTVDSALSGSDLVLLFGTIAGEGSLGVLFRLINADAPVIPGLPAGALTVAQYKAISPSNPFVVQYNDGELGNLGFLANNPPFGGTACVAMGPCMVELGIAGGYGGSPSNPNNPEAFDPENIFFLGAQEPITGVLPYLAQGVVYVTTQNSVNVLVLTGTSTTPVIPRGLWGQTGCAQGNALAMYEDQLYLMSGAGGPVRTQGTLDPDFSFALPVWEFMQFLGWTSANTFVFSAPDQGAMIFASGNLALPFMVSQGVWSAPIVLPGNITACCTVNGVGIAIVGSTAYKLNAGTGPQGGIWFMSSAFHKGQPRHPYVAKSMGMSLKQVGSFHVVAQNALTYSILKNTSQTPISPLFPWTAPGVGHQTMSPQTYATCRNYALKVSGTLGGQVFNAAQATVTMDPCSY